MTERRFETETCSRCGGSGHYSYCQMYGTTCFKCRGAGKTFTKRGAVAAAKYAESLKVPLGSLKVGDFLFNEGIPGYSKGFFSAVTEIGEPHVYGWSGEGADKKEHVGITVTSVKGGFTGPAETLVRKGWSKEEKEAKLNEALDFQDTLTKAGAVRKRS